MKQLKDMLKTGSLLDTFSEFMWGYGIKNTKINDANSNSLCSDNRWQPPVSHKNGVIITLQRKDGVTWVMSGGFTAYITLYIYAK